MIIVHAIWLDSRLHVWGEKISEAQNLAPPSPQLLGDIPTLTAPRQLQRSFAAASHDELARMAGDIYDGLLVSGAVASELTIGLPFLGEAYISSIDQTSGTNALHQTKLRPDQAASRHGEATPSGIVLIPHSVPALSFSPTDAIDFLVIPISSERRGITLSEQEGIDFGGSFRFWSKAAHFVLEQLVKQRFIPDVHHLRGDQLIGFWRILLDRDDASQRLAPLITAMPPVCRCVVMDGGYPEASSLVENFLWKTTDGLVRRALEGDDLAHSLLGRPDTSWPAVMCWLRSLVSRDNVVHAAPERCRQISDAVRGWISKLEASSDENPHLICFRIEPPSVTPKPATRESVVPQSLKPTPQPLEPADAHLWRLSIYLRSRENADLEIDAADLWSSGGIHPHILDRSFVGARASLRSDLARAATRFEPLAPCALEGGPLHCQLTNDEVYSLLREAARMLDKDGFVVQFPEWWNVDRPKFRMHMELRPSSALQDDQSLETSETLGTSNLSLGSLVEYNWRIALGQDDVSLEELHELANSRSPLVQFRNRWLEAPTTELKQALEFLSKEQGGRLTAFEALRRFYTADDLPTGLPVTGLRTQGWIEQILDSTQVRHLDPLETPAGFEGEMRPYQVRGLQWLRFLDVHGLGGCLADDMGLGKTIQMIAVWLSEREGGQKVEPTLLIVPMSLVGNWHREIARFAPSLRVLVHHGMERLSGEAFVQQANKHDVTISTYGLVHRDFEHLAAVDWQRITLDEAQNIKNPAAKQSRAVRALRSTRRVALTGTPVENRLSELWSIIDFLNPGYLGTAHDFRKRFAVPIERGRDTDRAERLRNLISPFVLRRVKSDPNILPDLPEKMEMKVFCNLTPDQAALYQRIVDGMLAQIEATDGIQRRGLVLATLVKLKQVCNHPQLVLEEIPLPIQGPVQNQGVIQKQGFTQTQEIIQTQGLTQGQAFIRNYRSGKCERLTEMLEEVLAEGDRALIFTQFREMGLLLQKILRDALNIETLFMHGGSTQKQRTAMVDRFQSGDGSVPVFILSLKTGGFGLNLTAANHVFHFDRWWNPAVEDQATDRAHRIGQHRRVQVHKFLCIGTLEERIDTLIEQKRNLADKIIGSGEQWLTELSTEALKEIITLSREAVSEDQA